MMDVAYFLICLLVYLSMGSIIAEVSLKTTANKKTPLKYPKGCYITAMLLWPMVIVMLLYFFFTLRGPFK